MSPFDHGLLVGDGVFETLRVYDGVPFVWTPSSRAARPLGGRARARRRRDAVTLRAAADDVLAANGLTDGRLRITVTGGPSPLGLRARRRPADRDRHGAPATPWPPTVDVVTVPWTPQRARRGRRAQDDLVRRERPRAARTRASTTRGEAIFLNTRGELCEATGSNVFVVRDGGC